MCVHRIVTDKWRGVQCEQEVLEHPDVDDFIRILLALDAHERTILCLSGKNELELTIGGGAGQYVVYASLSENEFCNLLSDPEAVGTTMLNVGGQEGEFAVRQVVDQARALQAGIVFLESGRLDSSLPWERQS